MQVDSPGRAEGEPDPVSDRTGEREARRWGRTRSGCLNCRKKRRKCDEGKPTCLRCRKRGETCQWGMRVTFREANTQMLVHGCPRQSKNRTQKTFQIMDVTSEVIRDYHQSSPTDTAQHPLLDRGSASPLHHAQDPGRREEAGCDVPKIRTRASQPLNSDDSERASEDLSMGGELPTHSPLDQSGGLAATKLSGPGRRTELSQPTTAEDLVIVIHGYSK